MNEILARVYAKQQAAINKKLQQEAQFQARREREIRAFVASPVWQTLQACKNMRLRAGGATLSSLMGYERDKVFAGQTEGVYFEARFGGHSSGIRWKCEESRDSGVMLYHSPHRADTTPNESFIASFIDFLAENLHPEEVAKVITNMQAETEQETNRRRLQPV
jgi:hypothetical protein